MNDKIIDFEQECQAAIDRVELAILNHELGVPDDLSKPLLLKLREELMRMKSARSPREFLPSYGRFILDWPNEYGLVSKLSQLNYKYDRLK